MTRGEPPSPRVGPSTVDLPLPEEVYCGRFWSCGTGPRRCAIDDRRGVSGPAPDSWLVADALSALAPDHRAVIVRAYYLGHSVAELAAALDVPQGTIRSRLHYGLHALWLALRERGLTGR
ncbi:sigma factor-like helix-turn-helix DNA-binding protein [Actinocrispum sp. NPDC049592]|uniref:sigma factor-like helix-turn-helix DNA-binding protein n=1 Tax=Actinocrispum sp. NPDC049592 TaxID=3154835 RepID=UPI003417F3CB